MPLLTAVPADVPRLLKKTTSPVTFNTTSAEQSYAQLAVPSGFFTAGRIIRLRAGGTYLLNSGTPTVRVLFKFGGTTLFSDISGASTGDTDRGVWTADVDFVAVSDTSQLVNGMLNMGIIAAKTAPTTGIGDAWSTAQNIGSVHGTSSVDAMSAGDKNMEINMTMSVSNGSNEIVCSYSTFELL